MTSKTLSLPDVKGLQKEYLKRRIWLIALTALLFFVYYVMGTIVYLLITKDNYKYMSGTISLKDYMAFQAYEFLGIPSIVSIITIPLAVICAYQAFFWIFKTQSVDFYLSQPVSRKFLFKNMYISNLLIYASLNIVFIITAIIICICMGNFNVSVLLGILVGFINIMILFFSTYNLTILAILIAKNHMMAVVMSFIILFSSPIIGLIHDFLNSVYYATYYSLDWILSAAELDHFPDLFSPIRNHSYITGFSDALTSGGKISNQIILSITSATVKYSLFSLAIGIISLILGYLVFNRRKAEDIGSGLIHPALKFLVKMIISIPGALFTVAIMESAMDNVYTGWHAVTMCILVFDVIITCMIIEAICNGNIRGMIKKIYHIAIALVITLGLFAIFKNDLTGYDSYSPVESNVESCVFFPNDYREYYDENGTYYSMDSALLRNMYLENTKDISKIALEGQQNKRNLTIEQNFMRKENAFDSFDPSYKGCDCVVAFRLKNGRIVARSVFVSDEADADTMDRIISDNDYKDAYYNLDNARAHIGKVSNFGVMEYNSGYMNESSEISPELYGKFIDCYSMDLNHYDYRLVHNTSPIGTLYYSENSELGYIYDSYPIYREYTNCVEFLRENNLFADDTIDPDRIINLEIYEEEYDDQGTYINTITYAYDEAASFSLIAPYIKVRDNDEALNHMRELAYPDSYGAGLYVIRNSDRPEITDYYCGYYILKDQLPDSIKKSLENHRISV